MAAVSVSVAVQGRSAETKGAGGAPEHVHVQTTLDPQSLASWLSALAALRAVWALLGPWLKGLIPQTQGAAAQNDIADFLNRIAAAVPGPIGDFLRKIAAFFEGLDSDGSKPWAGESSAPHGATGPTNWKPSDPVWPPAETAPVGGAGWTTAPQAASADAQGITETLRPILQALLQLLDLLDRLGIGSRTAQAQGMASIFGGDCLTKFLAAVEAHVFRHMGQLAQESAAELGTLFACLTGSGMTPQSADAQALNWNCLVKALASSMTGGKFDVLRFIAAYSTCAAGSGGGGGGNPSGGIVNAPASRC